MTQRLRIGYLHVGPAEHGIRRYGETLARAVGALEDVEVEEAEIPATRDLDLELDGVRRAANALSSCDLVHLQWSALWRRNLWGYFGSDLARLLAFGTSCRAPLVATIHDLQPHGAEDRRDGESGRFVEVIEPAKRAVRELRLERVALRALGRRTIARIVCTGEERARLATLLRGASDTRVIPHYVLARRAVPRDVARSALGFGEEPVVGIFGFLHRRKGHGLLLEACALLRRPMRIVFAGGAPATTRGHVEELRAAARRLGLGERLEITGYLDEGLLDTYLAAVDLAVAPFRSMSASGSLSMCIGAKTPMLVSDLPQIDEYNRMVPGAIRTFHPYEPGALARSIDLALDADRPSGERLLEELGRRLSVERVGRMHRDLYGDLARARKSA